MSQRSKLLFSLVVGIFNAGCAGSGAAPPIPVDTSGSEVSVMDLVVTEDTEPSIPDASFVGCEPYIGALAACSYQWLLPQGGCPRAPCSPGPCSGDTDCPAIPGDGAGERCVLGNCVWCWQDTDCSAGRACRAGRCIARADPVCPETPSCDADGCDLVSISEVPCPVCLCEGPFHRSCNTDGDCLSISSYKYARCVYGRCTECRNDEDCGGVPCLPPGVCMDAAVHPAALYGTWLVGWPGGLNHYSLFRFEPDGTFRRGRLPDEPSWPDDIPPFPCDSGVADQWPVLGTWEPVGEGVLRVRLVSGVPCDGEVWSAEFRVQVWDDGDGLSFLAADGQDLDAMRVPVDICDRAFMSCSLPDGW
jgi:hypothetical protein